MPAINDYELMMHGVQAVRRLVEGLACPINGASGVRAQFFPHQLQNVQRILSSTQIRFLIADEVGMGKTVQALMVAHAMRYQAGKVRVKVVVSNSELKSQWVKEFCRIDKEIKESEGVVWIDNGKDDDDFCSVLDESELPPYATTLDPLSMDLLIVDEPQNLSVDSLRYLSDRAADFPAILLLTATPNLRDLRRFCELLQVLEPERMEFCRRQVAAADREAQAEDETEDPSTTKRLRLRDLDMDTLQRVFNDFSQLSLENAEQDSLISESKSPTLSGMPQYQLDRILFDARSTYRHILLSSREDYPQHLPRRRLTSMVAEPTSVESMRMTLARDACRLGVVLNDVERRSLLQRGCVGGQSAASFVRYLAGRDDAKRVAVLPMLELVKKEQADCRLDTLVDWLSEFWRKDPTRKAVICAGDDATVRELGEELSWRLAEIGQRGRRVPLKIVMAESNAVGGFDLGGLMGADAEQWRRSAESTVQPYSTGKAQLLIASDEYGQAINLQCSDVLIFYSLPWRADLLNQWIGRVDRLGRDRVDPDKRNSPVKDVKLVLLHRPSDPSREVERLFSEYRLFSRSLQLDPVTVKRISREIDEVVIHADQNAKATDDVATPINDSGVLTGRWTPEHSQELFERIAHADPMPPVLTHCKYDAYVSSDEESAFANWIEQLCLHGMMSKQKVSKRYRGDGKRRVFSTLTQYECDGPTVPRLGELDVGYPAFFLARMHSLNPPRTDVTTGFDKKKGEPRRSRLHFFSHGNMLHDQIVQTYVDAGRTVEPIGFIIHSLGRRFYPGGSSLRTGNYLCGVGFVDPGTVYARTEKQPFEEDPTQPKQLQRVLSIEFAHQTAGLKADQRFVRGLAQAKLCVRVSVEDGGRYTHCDGNELFTPHWGKEAIPRVQRVPVAENLREKLPSQYKIAIAKEMKEHWSERQQTIREQIEERIECVCLEAADRIRLIDTMLADVEARTRSRRGNPSDVNDQFIQRSLKPRSDLLQRQREVIEENCKSRCELLQQSMAFIQSPTADSVTLQVTAQIQLREDPEAIFDVVESESELQTEFQQPPMPADPTANPRKPR